MGNPSGGSRITKTHLRGGLGRPEASTWRTRPGHVLSAGIPPPWRKSRPLYAAFAILFLTCGIFYGYGFIVSILSIVLFPLFFKQDPILVENTVQDETAFSSDQEILKLQPGKDLIVLAHNKEEVLEVNKIDQLQGNLANKTADWYSETESTDQLSTSDESDIEWPCSGRSQDFSDGSISDEESLIEIALTGEQYLPSLKDEDTKVCFQQKVPTLLPNDTFGQHGLKELFAEFNEEDNLIEIDIAMGSIKCSRFTIEP
ncbi:hypothetical protein AgCh_007160 [Apium graveolens]